MTFVLKVTAFAIFLFAIVVIIGFLLVGFDLNWIPFLSATNTEPTLERSVDPPPDSSGPYLTRTYEWEYQQASGSPWAFPTTHPFKLDLQIPENLYDYYKALERIPDPDYSVYVSHPSDDDFLTTVAEELESMANDPEKNFDTEETVNFVASFVQSFDYKLETAEEGEYPKYPIETLVDQNGDCEDSSILLAALLQIMGHEVVLVNFSGETEDEAGHMGIAIAGSYDGDYFPYEGTSYYYIETTGEGYTVGELSKEYKGRGATLYELNPIALLKFHGEYFWDLREVLLGRTLEVTARMTVKNWGTLDAEDAYVRASYDGEHWSKSQYFDLDAGYHGDDIATNIVVELEVPDKERFVQVQLISEDSIADEVEIDLSKAE